MTLAAERPPSLHCPTGILLCTPPGNFWQVKGHSSLHSRAIKFAPGKNDDLMSSYIRDIHRVFNIPGIVWAVRPRGPLAHARLIIVDTKKAKGNTIIKLTIQVLIL